MTSDPDTCHANQYADLDDTYDGSALCGCDNCREYTAERDAEEV
jgi:hypothetical protein